MTEPTIETQRKAFCDLTVERASTLMLESGAEIPMIVDRLITYGVAQVVAAYGKDEAITMLRGALDAIERGVFDKLEAGPVPADLN
jgi:hypothetical protein